MFDLINFVVFKISCTQIFIDSVSQNENIILHFIFRNYQKICLRICLKLTLVQCKNGNKTLRNWLLLLKSKRKYIWAGFFFFFLSLKCLNVNSGKDECFSECIIPTRAYNQLSDWLLLFCEYLQRAKPLWSVPTNMVELLLLFQSIFDLAWDYFFHLVCLLWEISFLCNLVSFTGIGFPFHWIYSLCRIFYLPVH